MDCFWKPWRPCRSSGGGGYGKALVLAALDHVRNEYGKPVYSHVWKRNYASMVLHAACGFTQVLDYAKLIDGSVNTSHVTLKCL